MSNYEDTTYQIIKNDKGNIYKLACKKNFPDFIKGDIYFSEVFPKTIKAWRRHIYLTCVIGVVSGEIILKIKSKNKKTHKTKLLSLSESNLVTIKPGNWYGFQNRTNETTLLFVMLNGEHIESDVERLEIDTKEW